MESITSTLKYDQYSDSGYEWIGEIPEHWDLVKLGSCLSPVSVKNCPELPLLSITREQGVIERDVDNQESNHNFIPDDLSGYKKLEKGQFGMNKMKAWQGSYGVSKFTGIVSPAYFIFDFTKAINPEFFNWAIRSKLYVSFFGSASDGVRIGQWDLSKARMKVIPFVLPSEEEQSLIANFLDKKATQINEAIAIKEKQISLLKERKQIIIQQAVTQGLDPNVPMKDSGVDWIGDIPAHWGCTAVKRLLDIPITDGPHTTPQLHDEGIPFISAEAIKGGEINFDKKRGYINEKDYLLFSNKYTPKVNDIYMVKSGATTGRVAIVRTEMKFTIWSPLAVFRVDKNKLNPLYLYYFLQSYSFLKGVELSWSFGTQQNIGMGVLGNLFALAPPLEEQQLIVNSIEPHFREIDIASEQVYQQIEKLKEYKTTLINSAVTGKIKITPEMLEQ
ncbi:restriction endonuclease subunit S [Escherichia coli]|uniref:restriction endonuclease subunit S n=1 Tax=Escherichia coli TaxID=562 RepID=UPI000BE620A7|nr:restriction endonuclease subunit S [Escherichia coli]